MQYDPAGLEAASTAVALEMEHICWRVVRQLVERYMGMHLEELLGVQDEQTPAQEMRLEGCMYWRLRRMICLVVGIAEEVHRLMVSSSEVVQAP